MTDETRTLIDAAVERIPQAEILETDKRDVVAVVNHPNSSVSFKSLEEFGEAPHRIRQASAHETPQSFAAYVNAFNVAGRTRLFASLAKREVRALVDFHSPEAGPSWVSHSAVYPAAFSPAFAAWRKVHGQAMGQKDFAHFLEDRAEDAVTPEPADLMEVAQNFSVLRNVNFISAINVNTNERQYRYEEKDSVGGSISAPKVIRLRTPVFYGCDPVEWAARFSYDISDGKLVFTVKVHRLEELLDAEFERLCDAIMVDCPGLPLHRGVA